MKHYFAVCEFDPATLQDVLRERGALLTNSGAVAQGWEEGLRESTDQVWTYEVVMVGHPSRKSEAA